MMNICERDRYSELRLIRLRKLRIHGGYPAEDTPLRRRPLEKAVLRRALCKTRRILVILRAGRDSGQLELHVLRLLHVRCLCRMSMYIHVTYIACYLPTHHRLVPCGCDE